MRQALIAAVLLAVLVATYIVVVNFSEAKTTLSCKGQIVEEGLARPASLHAWLNKYRWWVRLWGDGSDGNMQVEAPDGRVLYFGYLEDLGTVWHVYKGHNEREFQGSYSNLSKSLRLVTPAGFFEGTCTATN
jgi:hypothetical protein